MNIQELSTTEKLKLLSELALSLADTFKAEGYTADMAKNEMMHLIRQKNRSLAELEEVRSAVKDGKGKADEVIAEAERKADKIIEEAKESRSLAAVFKEEAKLELAAAKEEAKQIIQDAKDKLKGK